MKCADVVESLPLYLYGELTPDAEETVESHLHGCAECRGELAVHQRLHQAFDEAPAAPPAPVLVECRRELFSKLDGSEPERAPWWRSLLPSNIRAFTVPAGALAMAVLGFVAARATAPGGFAQAPVSIANFGAGDPVVRTVRSLQPDASGGVEIGIDETRRRTISGNLGDEAIAKLLLAAVRDQGNSGLRVESIDLLKSLPATDDVRGALTAALLTDSNPGVRLKAIEGLKGMGANPDVRKALAQVLLKDDNAGIRIQAIDLLMQHRDAQFVGVLQNVVQREQNNYVRQRCARMLEEMNASVGTF